MTKRVRSGDLAALSAAVRDVADRIGRLPQSRLLTRAAGGLDLAQHFADAAAGIEARAATVAPRPRAVPTLSVFAVGDQVAVTGGDVLAAADGLDPTEPVWHDGERRALAEVLAQLQARAAALRATL